MFLTAQGFLFHLKKLFCFLRQRNLQCNSRVLKCTVYHHIAPSVSRRSNMH